jgi:hypothetical protein
MSGVNQAQRDQATGRGQGQSGHGEGSKTNGIEGWLSDL